MGKAIRFQKYLFRGVPNKEYKIQASAYRRPKEDARNFERFLQINKNLIADARLRGHGERDGRELGDLEILAQFQHFGAATCLIDFTHNAQIALYFACQKDLKWEKKSQDSDQKGLKPGKKLQDSKTPPDGKVYAVRNDSLRFKKVTPDLLFSLKRYREAIADFSKMIELAPDFPFGYTRRGRARFELGQYQEAIADLDTAFQIDPDDVSACRLRGTANEHLGNLEAAKNDFQKALTLECKIYNARRVAEIKMELQRIEERIAKRSDE